MKGFLGIPAQNLLAGERSQAEAFIANAPRLFQRDRDVESIFMTIGIAISAIQADPTYGGGYALAAECLYRMGVISTDKYDQRALKAAGPWAQRATVVDPKYDNGWEVLITILCYLGDFKNAETMLGNVYKQFGDNDLYARTAFYFFRMQGNTKQALEWGALAWQTEWDNARLVGTLFSLGQLYIQEQEYRRALDAYRVITEKDFKNAWAYYFMAVCLNQLGQKDEAIECNLKALSFGEIIEFRKFQNLLQPPRRGNTRRMVAPRLAPAKQKLSGATPRTPRLPGKRRPPRRPR